MTNLYSTAPLVSNTDPAIEKYLQLDKKQWFMRKIFLNLMLLIVSLSGTLNLSAQTIGISTTGSTAYPTTTVGDNTTQAGNIGITTNIVQAANKFTVTGPLTITTFSIYISTSYGTNSMRFAVYPDNAGTPVGRTLTGQTGSYPFITGTGWKTITLLPADYIYIPAAGTYWLCFMGNVSTGQVRRLGTAVDYYFTQTYGSGYPATFPAATSENAGTYSFYATGFQIRGYSKATKAVLPADGTFSSLSFYSHAAGNARLAIYNNASGAPSAKQWESGSVAVTASAWTNTNISSGTPTSLNLTAGIYWLVWQWDNALSGPSYTAGAAGDGNYMIQSAYGSFPASWSGGTSTAEKWSLNATYCAKPALYSVTGGGNYCSAGSGVAVGLANSESGVTYQLYNNGGATSVGSPVTGTGAAISFGNQTIADTYTVIATRTSGGCTANMTGNAVVSINPTPLASVNSQTNVNCYGESNGTITIAVSGGTSPYNYSVDNGTTWTPDLPVLPNPYTYPGLIANHPYRIKVKDNNGCLSK